VKGPQDRAVGEGPTEGNVGRYTVDQAADMLGISTGAVRSRLSRGTLQSVREGGAVYVLLPAGMSRDADRDATDMSADMPDMPSSLSDQMRERVESLERQLEQANERDRENRRIIVALTSRIPAIEAPQEPTGTAETVEEEPERAEPRPTTGGTQEGTERPQRSGWLAPVDKLPWWHYLWGLFLVFLITYFTETAVTSIRFGYYGWSEFFSYSRWSTPVYLSILAAGAWLPAGLFGLELNRGTLYFDPTSSPLGHWLGW